MVNTYLQLFILNYNKIRKLILSNTYLLVLHKSYHLFHFLYFFLSKIIKIGGDNFLRIIIEDQYIYFFI